MNSTAILALIRNDIRLYFADRRAVLVGVLVPILIAAFFGYVFGGTGRNADAGRIPVAVVDEDESTVSRAITADLTADKLPQVTALDRAAARTGESRQSRTPLRCSRRASASRPPGAPSVGWTSRGGTAWLTPAKPPVHGSSRGCWLSTP
jgi:ABC-2 type transport system permease protein